jgi:nucleotide-binding universal stress UspA family protein
VLPDAEWPRSGQAGIVIVVGVDGSEASKEALRWALEEAPVRGSSLRVVYAWLSPQIGGRGYIPPDVLDPELLRQTAQERLDGFVAEVVGESPGVEIERVVDEGPAAQVLVEAAKKAELLVVGSRGHGGFAGLLLGSVSQQCAHHASCPVVIVRGHAQKEE